jgi:hypothetical protein
MADIPAYPADGRYTLPLYVTEGEIVKRAGWGIHSGRKLLQEMREHPKFPPKDVSGRRYWPSVCDFLDYWNKRPISTPAQAPASEPYRGRAWANLQAAQERVERRIARTAELGTGSHVSSLYAEAAAKPDKPKLGPDADEALRARFGYTDANGNFRKTVAGLKAGQVRVTGPDGMKWTENANSGDPRLWHRKRKLVPPAKAD